LLTVLERQLGRNYCPGCWRTLQALGQARRIQEVVPHSPACTIFMKAVDFRLKKNTQEFDLKSLHTTCEEFM
jgi:hypothetical protein